MSTPRHATPRHATPRNLRSFAAWLCFLLIWPFAVSAATVVQTLDLVVDLNIDFAPEGDLTPVAVQQQRAAIASAQANFVSSLPAGYRIKYLYQTTPQVALSLPAAALPQMLLNRNIKTVNQDEALTLSLDESRRVVGAHNAGASGFSGAGTTVVVLDTGIDKSHPALSGRIVAEGCYSTTGGTQENLCRSGNQGNNSGIPCSGVSGCDHGTHVGGIVAANGGVVGIAPQAQLVSMQVFSKQNSAVVCNDRPAPCLQATLSDIAKALEATGTLKSTTVPSIASVNMSLGSGINTQNCDGGRGDILSMHVSNLVSNGVAVVASSGNAGNSTGIGYPACLSKVISVGATTKSDAIASYSNSASILTLLAPGSDINSTVPNSSFTRISGTSMASPHVAAAMALLRQAFPSNTVANNLSRLVATGHLITDGRNNVTKPRIDIGKALGIPSIPQPFVAFNDYCYGSYDLTWGSSSGNPIRYELYQSNSSALTTRTLIYSGLNTEFDGSFPANTYFGLRACNVSGCSAFAVRGPTVRYNTCK